MASAYDKASLVMLPHAVKEDKLYSVKPEDRSGDFTFSRNSDIQATRVNSSGLIEKAKVNFVLHSQDFSNGAWVKNSLINTSFTETDPNGGSTAFKAESSGNGYIYQDVATSAGSVYVWSFYAKSDTPTSVDIRVDASTEAISLTTEWQRFSKFFVAGSGTTRLWMGAGFTWSNGEVAYMAFAQCNLGTIATDYVETTTTSVVEGLTADLPRLDYSGGASCPSLLLEPQRTNSVEQSEYFALGGAYWGNTRCTIENNAIVSPEGVQNASKLLQDSSTTNAGLVNKNITASGANTFSFYAKKGTKNFARLSLYSSVETSVYFDLENGEIGTTNLIAESDCFIEDMGNDWYRCGATYSGTINRFNIYVQDRDGEPTLLDATDAYIYIYGAQWEASASYPTSYIPTYSASAQRNADVCNNTSATDVIGQTEGTLFVDFVYNGLSNTNGAVFLLLTANGGASNRVQISLGSVGDIVALVLSGGASIGQANTSSSYLVEGTRYKVAVSYSVSGGLVLYVNGTLIDSDTLASVPSRDRIHLNDYLTSGIYIGNLECNQNLLFKTALTNAELAALTTL